MLLVHVSVDVHLRQLLSYFRKISLQFRLRFQSCFFFLHVYLSEFSSSMVLWSPVIPCCVVNKLCFNAVLYNFQFIEVSFSSYRLTFSNQFPWLFWYVFQRVLNLLRFGEIFDFFVSEQRGFCLMYFDSCSSFAGFCGSDSSLVLYKLYIFDCCFSLTVGFELYLFTWNTLCIG